MSKLLGVLTGILLAGAAFLVCVDGGEALRRFGNRWNEIKGAELSHPVEQVRQQVSSTVPSILGEAQRVSPEEGFPTAELPDPHEDSDPPQKGKIEEKEDVDSIAAIEGAAPGPEEPPAPSESEGSRSPHRQAFWKPFRTELSARGFAMHIGNATGLPIEVVQEGPARFQVAFPYRDEQERRANMALIRESVPIHIEWSAGS